MLCVGESQAFSNNMMNLSLRHGNAFKTIYQNVLIMGWRIGYLCRLSNMGWLTVPMRLWMLLLEVHSCHLHFQLWPLLWRRWHPTKAGMKNVFRPAREMEVVTPKFGRRVTGTRELPRSCQQGINCIQIRISWFECSTGISFLQAAPTGNDKGYDRCQDETWWTLQKGKD